MRFPPILLKKMKTAMNVRLAFLKFRIWALHPNNLQKVCLNLFSVNLLEVKGGLRYIQDQLLLSAENKNTSICSLLQCRVPVSMFE